MSTFTEYDLLVLDSMGVDTDPGGAGPRSDWTAERVLQAAADDAISVVEYPTLIEIAIDGRDATDSETQTVVDLVVSGLLVWLHGTVYPTAAGREELRRWSQHRSLPRRDGGDSR